MALNRRKEREIVYQMLFASQFYPEEETPALYEIMIPQLDEGAESSEYVKKTFFGALFGAVRRVGIVPAAEFPVRLGNARGV